MQPNIFDLSLSSFGQDVDSVQPGVDIDDDHFVCVSLRLCRYVHELPFLRHCIYFCAAVHFE